MGFRNGRRGCPAGRVGSGAVAEILQAVRPLLCQVGAYVVQGVQVVPAVRHLPGVADKPETVIADVPACTELVLPFARQHDQLQGEIVIGDGLPFVQYLVERHHLALLEYIGLNGLIVDSPAALEVRAPAGGGAYFEGGEREGAQR